MSEILKEAFKELQNLNEDTFSFDKEGIFNLDRFLKADDSAPDVVNIIDVEADSEKDLKSTYAGKAILRCCVCEQLIYKDPKDVHIDEDLQRANVDEDCPHCGCIGGYEVVGQVAPYVDMEKTDITVDGDKVEVEEASTEADEKLALPVEESLNESVDGKPSIANYFKDVDEGEGWVTLELAEEGLERSEDEIADWLDKHPTVGYIYNIEDIQVICTPHAPSFDSIAAELGITEYEEEESDESLNEDFHKATVETGDSTLSMETDENGKITVTSEPRKVEESGEEMVAPVSDEIKAEIDAANEEPEEEAEEPIENLPEEPAEEDKEDMDFDIDEIDEDSFNELGESYFQKVYDNVDHFQTTGGKIDGDKILIEGVITFCSGKQAKTNFLFEGFGASKKGRLKFLGENAQISKRKNAFSIQGRLEGKKLITESLTYNYRALDSKTGKGYNLYGTVKNK